MKQNKLTAILSAAHGKCRQRGLQPYLHPFEILEWFVSVDKHSPLASKAICRLGELEE